MTEEGFNSLIAAMATKGNRNLIPREQGAQIAALGPEEFEVWLAESIKNYQRKVKTAPEHIYEFVIRKDGTNAEGFLKRMDGTFFVSDKAKQMMKRPRFMPGFIEDKVVIRVYRADALGVEGWPEKKFLGPDGRKHLENFGLAKCQPDDAHCIREAHEKQEPGESIMVAHDLYGYFEVFSVGNDAVHGLHLYSINTGSRFGLSADALVAVRVASQN
jgi:hypothetical protein